MTIIQYIIRDVATGCPYTGAHQTLSSARKAARKYIAKYGGAVTIMATDGLRDEQTIEQIEEGAWR